MESFCWMFWDLALKTHSLHHAHTLLALYVCKVCIRYDCSISRLAQFLLCWCYDVWVSVYNQSNHILTQLGSVLSKPADHISHFADFRLHIHWLPITSYFTSHFWSERWEKQKPNITFPPLTPLLGRPGQTWLLKKVSANVWTKTFLAG